MNGSISSMKLIIISITASLGAFLGFFMAFLLFRIDGTRRMANGILALLLINFSVVLIVVALAIAHVIDMLVAHFVMPLYFFAGPLLFFYVRNYSLPGSGLSVKDLVHSVPALTVLAFYLAEYFFADYFSGIHKVMTHPAITRLVWYLFLCQFSIYLVVSISMLRKLIKGLSDKAWLTAVEIQWLGFVMKFFIAALILLVGTTAYDMTAIYSGRGKPWASEILFILFSAVLVCSISYKGLINPLIFFGDDDDGDDAVKYNLSDQRVREIMTKVREVMERGKPYLDPDLTLPALAAMAGVPRGDLSSAINSDAGQNFYDFINTFRIMYVKELFEKSDPDVKVLEIAFRAGFSSKSTFNDVFKRITGLTPSEYRKSLRG